MPTWGEILLELNQSATARGGLPDFDAIRRKYLAQLAALTGRDTIIYYSDWLAGGVPQTAITLEDVQGMMEVCTGMHGAGLDLLIHSPGGSAEDTASIVRYLRGRYGHIRAFVPLAAMSAATMWALAGDTIVMGAHSQLGPIDPQVLPVTGGRYVPARAIVEQFERAKEECKDDPAALGAWLPILQQYGPSLIAECEDAEQMSKRLVKDWLASYMFKGAEDAHERAQAVADYFGDYTQHRSHSLGIDRDTARKAGVEKIEDLESDPALQDAVLSVHHATLHTLSGPAVKIVENHLGRAFVKLTQQFAVPTIQLAPEQAGGSPPLVSPAQPGLPSQPT
ncbi:MAG: serine protease [Actinomycetota bacterium]|nr:serine protease [Actinomycetota bacterium]